MNTDLSRSPRFCREMEAFKQTRGFTPVLAQPLLKIMMEIYIGVTNVSLTCNISYTTPGAILFLIYYCMCTVQQKYNYMNWYTSNPCMIRLRKKNWSDCTIEKAPISVMVSVSYL